MYRLLTRQTYEYEMFERASRKLAIETVVLNHEKMLKNVTVEVNETPADDKETVNEANETPTEANEMVTETVTADNETPITTSETPAGENAETRTLPEESSIAECQLNDTLTEDQESVSTKQGSGNQLEDLPAVPAAVLLPIPLYCRYNAHNTPDRPIREPDISPNIFLPVFDAFPISCSHS